jgi:hypothetical protein
LLVFLLLHHYLLLIHYLPHLLFLLNNNLFYPKNYYSSFNWSNVSSSLEILYLFFLFHWFHVLVSWKWRNHLSLYKRSFCLFEYLLKEQCLFPNVDFIGVFLNKMFFHYLCVLIILFLDYLPWEKCYKLETCYSILSWCHVLPFVHKPKEEAHSEIKVHLVLSK